MMSEKAKGFVCVGLACSNAFSFKVAAFGRGASVGMCRQCDATELSIEIAVG